jgi:hypothetical protein
MEIEIKATDDELANARRRGRDAFHGEGAFSAPFEERSVLTIAWCAGWEEAYHSSELWRSSFVGLR